MVVGKLSKLAADVPLFWSKREDNVMMWIPDDFRLENAFILYSPQSWNDHAELFIWHLWKFFC